MPVAEAVSADPERLASPTQARMPSLFLPRTMV